MNIYAQHILEHAKNPCHYGTLEHATVLHNEKNTSCGDDLSVALIIDKNNIIQNIAWHGEGCAISKASMSMLSETAIGMSIENILLLTSAHLLEGLRVPIGIRREKCALLGLLTLKNTILKHLQKPMVSWLEILPGQ